MPSADFRQGDARTVLAELPAASVQCVVTSPPYYGLRDYGVDGQIGLEATPDAYVSEMVALFRGIRRVLRDDGTAWLNLGDSYASSTKGSGGVSHSKSFHATAETGRTAGGIVQGQRYAPRRFNHDVKDKDLLMIPARVALALQSDGWYLRSEIIWHKPNPMPESVRDRPTSAHEKVFLLTKCQSYYYGQDAVREPYARIWNPETNGGSLCGTNGRDKAVIGGHGRGLRSKSMPNDMGANLRNVWSITTKPYRGAHFATMPIDLAERCIKAGSKPGDTILDPFGGAGTTALAAQTLDRNSISIELNPDYIALARQRLDDARPKMLALL